MSTKIITFKTTRSDGIKLKPTKLEGIKEEKEEKVLQKVNNNTNSMMSSTPKKSIYEIYNDKDELEEYLKNNCPEFWEKFELLEFKKNGSAGSVLKAQTKLKNKNATRKFVALKFLYNGKGSKKPKKEISHQEIMIHGLLKHKNIPQIYGYYKIGDNSCIAMEYSNYGDLENFKKRVIKRAPLSVRSCLLYSYS